jgi:large subunit ribosomal protein L24
MERIRKGDLVEVIAGKEKGKRARVLRVLHQKGRVVLEQLMMVKRHTKAAQGKQSGILDKEGSIHISNVMPIDPATEKPTRVKTLVKDQTRHRAGKSGTIIEAQR